MMCVLLQEGEVGSVQRTGNSSDNERVWNYPRPRRTRSLPITACDEISNLELF